jgi:uncharacterized protein (DUF952 family)
MATLGPMDSGLSAERIVHLALPDDWEHAATTGSYPWSTRGLTFAEVGFVHCARIGQIEGVARRFYDDVHELVVLDLDPTRLGADLLDEPAAEGGGELFPHLYGELPTTAVSAVHRWRRGPDGWHLGR